MILACDVSTVKVGFAILSADGKNILLSDVLFLDPKSIGLNLTQRAKIFENYVYNIKSNYKISKIIIEDPLLMVAVGTGSAWSTGLLQKFNGMCSYIVYSIFNLEPEFVNVNRARSFVGIKFLKGTTKKRKKEIVIEFIKSKFPEFKIEKTKFNNYKPGIDDMADALVLSLYGLQVS